MADSIREQIAVELIAILEGMTVANGFELDMGLNAHRAQRSFDPADLPGCALWLNDEVGETEYSTTVSTMAVSIDAHQSVSFAVETSDAVINQMIADVRMAMESYSASLYALITGVQYSGLSTEYPEDGGSVASVTVTYSVNYKTVRGDPYTVAA